MSNSGFKPRIKEKRWNPKLEEELIKLWEEEGVGRFRREELGKKPILVIDTPPPYPSGRWHVGGAAHYTHHDMIARFFRMIGYNVLIPFYADRNGLPVEVAVEKKYGINPHEIASTPEGRMKFLELCKKHLDEVEKEIVEIWKRLGCSFEYWRNGTDSPEYRRITQSTFIELWRRGLIYEDERPVNWCPRCRTTLSDAELEYKETKAELYYVRFKVKETGENIVIATTRPELLVSCRAVIFHPEDTRYQKLQGLTAVVPIYEHEVPIIPHKQANPEFGTGLVMICSYGDQTDVRLFRELGLKPLIVIDEKGFMKPEAGLIAGLPVREARKKIVEELEKRGLLEGRKSITHSIPYCWRCGTPIEFIHVKEYFLKQLEFKQDLLKIVEKISFHPEFHKKRLIDWINSVASDWPISRSRFYATEIPVWRCTSCGAILVPEEGRYYRPWIDPTPWDKCPKCGAPKERLVGEKKVFDTWFDSSISPLYVTGYKRDPELYEHAKDNVLRPQGQDIVRTWLYYTILRVYQLTGRPAFKYVRITGMGLDEKGEAMHKSKGNVIDPQPIIDEYGADAFRFWAAASAKLGYDYKFSMQLIRTGQLFATKLWNIARFVSAFPDPGIDNVKLTPLDYGVLEKLNETAKAYIEAFKNLDTFEPAHLAYDFTWNVFASQYIETVKARAYNREGAWTEEEQRAAWATLHEVLRGVLKMVAPIMPFVTDAVWRRMYGGCIHETTLDLPRKEWDKGYASLFDKLMSLNSEIWKYKKKHGMSLAAPLDKKVIVPAELRVFEREIKALHKLSSIEFSQEAGEVIIVE